MKAKIINAFMIVGVILLISTTYLKTGETAESSIIPAPDLSNHPIYTNYKFNNTENVVNLGCQPLYLPTSLITEAMNRDTILRNALSKLNSKIRFYAFLKGDDVNFFLKRNDLDVGIGGDMSAITAAATLDVIIPALIQQGFTSLIANRPMLISELRGKRIGYASGSNAHYTLLKALSSGGLNEDQVNLIPMETNEMQEALYNNKIDAFSAWEPTPTITLMKNPESAVIHRYLSSGYIYFLKSFLDKHPEIVYQIIAAEIRAIRWMQSDRQNLLRASEWVIQACAALSGRNLELTVDQYASLALKDLLGITSVPIIPRNVLKQNGLIYKEFIFFQAKGKIHASINWEKVRNCFNHQIIFKVLATTKKYRLDEFNYVIE